ncbi:BQ5605_C011g06639 [Microbotryum silenes-dioicae]|uniref:BQ5605_C011g06639 protein n=1 Tax=Microbotryum silenes-dioicae TaxID=796604 RepID=A0A2X0NTL6_9BASI|nr:BQ5605_C011g06639 [Microbotryum silenes-dioicae]
MADPTLSSPHHHLFLRRGQRQMAVCAHCKARHWECKGRTGHFSMCCLQGKVQLSPLSGPIPSINSYLKARIAICLIDPAEATDTRLGLDGADSRIQRSTLNKLESMLRTKNHFVREGSCASAYHLVETDAPTTFLRRARKWRCLSAIPTPTREIVDVKTLFSRCTVIDVPRVGPSTKSLARSIRLRCLSVTHYYFLQGKMASTPTFLFAGFAKLGCQSPETESRSTMGSNHGRYLPVSVLLTKAKRRTKTATMRMKTAGDEENGDGERTRLRDDHQGDEEYLAYYLHERGDYFSIPHATQRLLLEFVTDGYSQVETDRLNYIRFRQENLRLTTAQGITDAVANGLTPDQIGRSRYQDAMACIVKYGKPSLFITVTCNTEWPEIKAALEPNDEAYNRPDLIARMLKAKSGNKQRPGCFGDEWILFLCCTSF